MKRFTYFLLSLLLVAGSSSLFSQYQYELMKMSEGVHNGVFFDVGADDEDQVEDVWKDFMDERSLRVKRSSRRPREYRAEDIKGDEISTLFGADLFMQMEEKDTAVRVKIWVRRGETFPDFWGEEDAQKELKSLLDHFQHALKMVRAENALELAKDELKDMERDFKRLQDRKESYEKRIEKAYEEIEENEKNIVDNEAEQKALKKELEAQKERVEKRQQARERIKNSPPQ